MTPNNLSSQPLVICMRDVTDGERNRLIKNHDFLVGEVAAEFRGTRGIPLDDLMAQGMLGLILASKGGYRPESGSFIAYASECIRNEIRGLIRNWQPMVTAHNPDGDTEREFWEWSIWSYAAPYEQWTTL